MPVKKILLSFSLFFLCKVSFALVWIPEPFAKYNVSKTHYLISVPDLKSSVSGYTAVFEAKTNKFMYRIDQYFGNYHVFISDDGSQLMYFHRKFETNKGTEETCNLHFFDGKKTTSTIEIFKSKNIQSLDGFSINSIYDVDQELNTLSLFSDDLIYDIDLTTRKVTDRENTSTSNMIDDKLSEDFMSTASLMSIQNIQLANNLSLKQELLQDLDLKEVPDQASAQIVIYYNLRVSKDNTFSKIQFQTFGLLKKGSSSSNHKLLTKLMKSTKRSNLIPTRIELFLKELSIGFMMERFTSQNRFLNNSFAISKQSLTE